MDCSGREPSKSHPIPTLVEAFTIMQLQAPGSSPRVGVVLYKPILRGCRVYVAFLGAELL